MNNDLSIDEMIQKILCLIEELYACKYIKKLSLEKLPVGYKLSIPLSNDEKPFVICIEAEGDDYFKYLRTALLESSLNRIKFSHLQLELPEFYPNNNNITQ